MKTITATSLFLPASKPIMYVRASDVIPGNLQTVQHVIAYVDTSGVARKLDAADPAPGYTRFGDVGFEPVSRVGRWAPGTAPAPTPKRNMVLVAQRSGHRDAGSLLPHRQGRKGAFLMDPELTVVEDFDVFGANVTVAFGINDKGDMTGIMAPSVG